MKTRPIKELLILLRDYFPTSDLKDRGALCLAIRDMWQYKNMINEKEEYKLRTYIQEKRWKADNIVGATPDSPYYFFPDGECYPRLEFLDKLIAEL